MSFKSNGYTETPPELDHTLLPLSDIDGTPLKWISKEIQSQVPTDILFITANDDEFIACYSYMKQVQRSWEKKLGWVYFGRFVDKSCQDVKVALMRRGIGSKETHKAVKNGAEVLIPKVTLFVGNCETMNGMKGCAKRGDVAISAKLTIYNLQFRSDDTFCGGELDVGPDMATLILSAADGWKPPLKDPNSFKVDVHRDALMLSGLNYIKNHERLEELKETFPIILVIDVGEIGLYEAAFDLEMEWAIVKGVSDLAGESNLEEVAKLWKQFASIMATSVVHNMFKYSDVLEDWPNYKEVQVTKGKDRAKLPPPELSITLKKQEDIRGKYFNWSNREIKSQLIPTDILLITTNNHEFNACYSYMEQIHRSINTTLGSVDFGRFGEDQSVRVALVRCQQGPGDTQTVARNGARILRPKVVLFVGICATMKPEKANLGDVLISAKLAAYDHKKIEAGGKVVYRGPITNVSRNMNRRIMSAADGWKPPLKDPESLIVNVKCDALMLSGSVLVNDPKTREKLAADFPNALGLEMEGAGLYEAAYDLSLEWAVVKAVSDYAEHKDGTERWQPFAGAMAASVVYNMFKHPGVLDDWPNYKSEAIPTTSRNDTKTGQPDQNNEYEAKRPGTSQLEKLERKEILKRRAGRSTE